MAERHELAIPGCDSRAALPCEPKGVLKRVLSIPGALVIGLIRVYRYTLSALIGRQCRYLPTCSEYAEEAIAHHGAWAGGWAALARFARCNPWGSSGFDPVPGALPSEGRWYKPWRYGRWSGRHITLRTEQD